MEREAPHKIRKDSKMSFVDVSNSVDRKHSQLEASTAYITISQTNCDRSIQYRFTLLRTTGGDEPMLPVSNGDGRGNRPRV